MTSNSPAPMDGQTFWGWTVVKIDQRINRRWYWIARCQCGTVRSIDGYKLRSGASRSCGCGFRPGQSGPDPAPGSNVREYRSWHAMRDRCDNPSRPGYSYYGGRGITYCDRWASFTAFLEDMGARPEGATLDRIDGEGNYEPGNCRWADLSTQNQNRRSPKRSRPQGRLTASSVVEIRRRVAAGETQAVLAEVFQVSTTTIYNVAVRKSWRDVA